MADDDTGASDGDAGAPDSDSSETAAESNDSADGPLVGGATDAERDAVPSVDVPDASAASPQLRRRFWGLVIVFNVAVLALSLGVMLVAFRGRWQLGGQLVAAGAVLFAYGLYAYRRVAGDLE